MTRGRPLPKPSETHIVRSGIAQTPKPRPTSEGGPPSAKRRVTLRLKANADLWPLAGEALLLALVVLVFAWYMHG
jgi:hypothetical protein